jgi:CheY-specific phosphatase CheX
MMENNTDTTLVDNMKFSLLESLEGSAFLFADEELENPIRGSDALEYLGWRISYSGSVSGVVQFFAPPDFAKLATANMLGIQVENLDIGMIDDAMGELLNMGCGHFLTRHYGEKPVFNLDAPVAIAKAGYKMRDMTDILHWVSVEETALAFSIQITWSAHS